MERRRLVCGNPYSFQGDERDIMFLSLVAASNERIGPLAKAADERRFNVAASRARNVMVLFHSVTCDDLSASCLRRRLLDFFEKPTSPPTGDGIDWENVEYRAYNDCRSGPHRLDPPPQFHQPGVVKGSWFEVAVALEIHRKEYHVIPQFPIRTYPTYHIDLVVEGGQVRLAVECDGDHWHGADRYEADMLRQRQLERCGWEFFRVRECAFYASRENTMKGLWQALEERGIFPESFRTTESSDQGLTGDILDDQDTSTAKKYSHNAQGEYSLFPDSGDEPTRSGRRPDEVTTAEIQDAIVQALSKCANHSCTLQSLTTRVLREVGVLTRGNPRLEFGGPSGFRVGRRPGRGWPQAPAGFPRKVGRGAGGSGVSVLILPG